MIKRIKKISPNTDIPVEWVTGESEQPNSLFVAGLYRFSEGYVFPKDKTAKGLSSIRHVKKYKTIGSNKALKQAMNEIVAEIKGTVKRYDVR